MNGVHYFSFSMVFPLAGPNRPPPELKREGSMNLVIYYKVQIIINIINAIDPKCLLVSVV